MIARRIYAPHRRAYYPRTWPTLVVTVPAAIALGLLLPLWAVIVGSVAIGFCGGWGRWSVWRRRHPVISAEEYAADYRERMRRAARWN
jgi:hypothetical protein